MVDLNGQSWAILKVLYLLETLWNEESLIFYENENPFEPLADVVFGIYKIKLSLYLRNKFLLWTQERNLNVI